MTKPIAIHIIAAQPDTKEVLFDEKVGLAIGDFIIAYRLETYEITRADGAKETYTDCLPITIDGDTIAGSIGIQYADKSVTIYSDCRYLSFEEALADYLPSD
jgi:hypothetical protein